MEEIKILKENVSQRSYFKDPRDKSDEELILIKTMKNIKNCKILNYGLTPINMKYFYCSCDPNKIDPICEECATNCHKNHILSEPLEGRTICACGFKAHNVSNDASGMEQYKKICPFFDIANISQRLVYYINQRNEKICMFCNVFCDKEKNEYSFLTSSKYFKLNMKNCDENIEEKKVDFDNENQKIIIKINKTDKNNNISDLSICECSHENHSNIKMILEITSNMGLYKDYFEDLNANQLLNILFISKKIYQNNYSLFDDYFKKNFQNKKFKIDSNIHLTNFYYSLKNFYNISKYFEKHIRYSCETICNNFNYNFILNAFDSNLTDNISNWSFYNCVLGIFQKCCLGNFFTRMTKFKISDFENLSITQRLCYIKYKYSEDNKSSAHFAFINEYINGNKNIINSVLNFFNKVVQSKFSTIEGLELVFTIISIIYRLSSYYLLKADQKQKFIIILENCLGVFNNLIINIKEVEKIKILKVSLAKIFVKIIKTFIFLAYEENDSIIYNEFIKKYFINKENLSLNNEVDFNEEHLKNIKFFHMKNDFGMNLSKVFIQILDLSRKEFQDYKDFLKSNKAIKEILNDMFRYQNHLLSLFIRTKDSYMIGLRSFFLNYDVYYNLFNNKNNLPNEFGESINSMEAVYGQYLNFSCQKKEVVDLITNLVNSFMNTHKDSNQDRNEIRSVLFYSEFIQTVMKSVKILSKTLNEADKNYIEGIFLLLKFFIKDNIDNSMLLLSEALFDYIQDIPFIYSKYVFELIYQAIFNLNNGNIEIYYTKPMLKRIYNYLIKSNFTHLKKEMIKETNYEDSIRNINYFLKIAYIIIFQIPCINVSITYEKTHFILKDMFDKFEFFKKFIDFLINVSKKYGEKGIIFSQDLKSEINNVLSDQLFKYHINEKFVIMNNPLFLNIFLLFIKLINISFEEPQNKDLHFLRKLITIENISYILKNKHLDIQIRTELLKFLRKFHLDFNINREKTSYYISALSYNFNISKKYTIKSDYNAELYSFLDDINSISERDNNKQFNFDYSIKDILLYELKNYSLILENEPDQKSISLLNYLEQGLFLTISVYFHKVYCNVELMSGEEFLHVYELFELFLEMKNFYLNNFKNRSNNLFEKEKTFKYLDEEVKKKNVRVKKSIAPSEILGNLTNVEKFQKYFSNLIVNAVKPNNLNKSQNSKSPLYLIKNMSYCAFDYTYIYGIVEEQLHDLVQKPSSLDLLSEYNKNEFNYEKFLKLKTDYDISENLNNKNNHNQNESEIENVMLKICYFYENSKGDLNNSSISSILGEISLENEVSYRNSLLNYLIFAGSNNNYFHKHFSPNCDFIIFKLLQYNTKESQNEIKSIFNKYKNIKNHKTEENIDILKIYAENLFDKLIRILINNFNPPQSGYDINYIIAFNIIKIFKFLCEEHNNYFQGLLIKTLSFKKEILHKYIIPKVKKQQEQTISFFDLILLTINKLILCSKWDKTIKDNDDYNIDYLYDLLAALIELLIEIVQGNTEENLSYIGCEEIDDDSQRLGKTFIFNVLKRSSTLFSETEYDLQENGNANFEVFITQIRSLIFLDSGNSKILYRVRTNLMNFLISLLEEKNCNKKIKDIIISTIPVEEVINSISSALKIHYHKKNTDPKQKSNNVNEINADSRNDSQMHIKLENSDNVNNNSEEEADSFQLICSKKFNMKMFSYYLSEYFNTEKEGNDYLSENDAFIFSNTYFHLIKLISLLYKDSEANYLLNKVENLSQVTPLEKLEEYKNSRTKSNEIKPIELVNDDELHIDEKFMEIYLIIRFFDEITKTVEIKTEDKNIQRVIFTVLPTIKNLSNETKIDFITNVNRENAYTKLNGLIESVDLFEEEIVYKTKHKPNKFQKFVSNINFYWIQVFIFLIALAINMIILITVEGDKETGEKVASAHRLLLHENNRNLETHDYNKIYIDESYINSNDAYEFNKAIQLNKETLNDAYFYSIFNPAKNRILGGGSPAPTVTNSTPSNSTSNTTDLDHSTSDTNSHSISVKAAQIQKDISNSIHKNEVYYKPLTLILIILCALFIIIYSIGKLPMYYYIDKMKYMKKNEKEENELTFFNKLNIILILSIYNRNQINTLIFIFINAIISYSIPDEIISYTFMLLTLINLIPTLSNIIVAVKLKYLELLLTYLLTCIIIWAHSSIGFYLFNEDFALTLEHNADNFCSSMIFCFLTSVDYGFRTRGGIGELIKRISFERNKGRYMGRLFYDIIYFILIVVLMLELVFGIIVETFRDLRIDETHHDYDKANICFICGIKKDDLEKNRQNFKEHCEKVHNIWNYINYMLRLKFSDSQDLNAINSFALENIEKKKISWVPLIEKNQSINLGNHEEQSTEEESEIDGSVNEEERVVPKINH